MQNHCVMETVKNCVENAILLWKMADIMWKNENCMLGWSLVIVVWLSRVLSASGPVIGFCLSVRLSVCLTVLLLWKMEGHSSYFTPDALYACKRTRCFNGCFPSCPLVECDEIPHWMHHTNENQRIDLTDALDQSYPLSASSTSPRQQYIDIYQYSLVHIQAYFPFWNLSTKCITHSTECRVCSLVTV